MTSKQTTGSYYFWSTEVISLPLHSQILLFSMCSPFRSES